MENNAVPGRRDFLAAQASALNELLEVQEKAVVEQSEKLDRARAELDKRIGELQLAQQRWQSTFDAIEHMILIFDSDRRIVAANRAALEMFPGRDVVGAHCYELIHGTDAPPPDCPCPQVFLSGRPAHTEQCESHLGGRWLHVDFAPILGDDGAVHHVVHVACDVTERKRSEEALSESEARSREMAELLPETVFELSLEGRVTFLNWTGLEQFGYTREDIEKGVSAVDVTPALHRAECREQIASVLRGEEPATNEFVALRKDGTTFPANFYSTRIIRDGRPAGVRGILVNVNRQKAAERQLAEANDHLEAANQKLRQYAADLEHANEEVKQFAYIVSHDLRTPLVNIKGFAGELRHAIVAITPALEAGLPLMGPEPGLAAAAAFRQDIPEALGFIDSSATHMDHFISAVLKLSRLGRSELHPEPVPLAEVVEAALRGLAHQVAAHQAQVMVGPLPEVWADRTAIEQIVGNILVNAVNYLESGRPGMIEVTAERTDRETVLAIRDNGRGIAPEDMPKVFALFRRAGRQDVPGEGMGLAYVQMLVRRHGGQIRCESQPGVGTTFTVALPNRPEQGGVHDSLESDAARGADDPLGGGRPGPCGADREEPAPGEDRQPDCHGRGWSGGRRLPVRPRG